MMITALTTAAVAGWMPSISPLTLDHRRSAILCKAPPVERGAEVPQSNINVGSICEFHDPKHGAGKTTSVLGVCESSMMKAKGGEKVTLVDANGKKHCVAAKAIHIVLPPVKTKEEDPAVILKPFLDVAEKNAVSLGVEPEMLELAWETLKEDEEADAFSPKQVIQVIDDKLYKSAVDRYRAFRLLTSDLGKVFFKSLSGNTFRPKSAASVETSKEQWCHAPGHGDMWKQEFCFV